MGCAHCDNSVEFMKPIEYIYSEVEAKELEKPSLFNSWSLKRLPQLISLMHVTVIVTMATGIKAVKAREVVSVFIKADIGYFNLPMVIEYLCLV